MPNIDFNNQSHRRYNPLTQTWVLCSPHRAKRPWQGQVEKLQTQEKPQYDPKCYLCPSNSRVGGHINPNYESTFTFQNDFPAVMQTINYQDKEEPEDKENELFKAEPTRGDCFVICFNPNHKLTVAQMTVPQITQIISAWKQIYTKCCEISYISYCQIFENKGEIMGCSNPHPHGQVWGTEQIPEEPRKEIEGFLKFKQEKGCCLLCEYVKQECERRERVVCENDEFVCLVPWWAVWPYETMILSKSHLRHLLEFRDNQVEAFADIIRRAACKYDNVFETSFPYSMGLHQAPCYKEIITNNVNLLSKEKQQEIDLFHFHMHFYPPLLRSATVKKFLVGFEMLGTPQRDLTPEQAAERLRQMSETHYSLK